MRLNALFFQFFLFLVVLGGSGCSTMAYYAQAISGQFSILNKRQPISGYVDDPNTTKQLKEQLNLILKLRDFAEKQLHLPVNGNYLTYVDLKRPYVLWNVFAAPEFSLSPKTWCYPLIGCMAYRGYFSKDSADKYAGQLNRKGYETFVGGVVAYSTLGWFNDPVFSTYIHQSPVQLSAIIFHELAHQLIFIPDDTTFNEGFATVVEQEGLRRWLSESQNFHAIHEYQLAYDRKKQIVDLVMKYKSELMSLYRQTIPPLEKRTYKADVFNRMRDEYHQLKLQWNEYTGYETWFNLSLNNAKMISVTAYYDLVPAFFVILKNQGNDLELFYSKCQKLAEKSKIERHAYLKGL